MNNFLNPFSQTIELLRTLKFFAPQLTEFEGPVSKRLVVIAFVLSINYNLIHKDPTTF